VTSQLTEELLISRRLLHRKIKALFRRNNLRFCKPDTYKKGSWID